VYVPTQVWVGGGVVGVLPPPGGVGVKVPEQVQVESLVPGLPTVSYASESKH
jgi:hypothetical protein